MPWPCPPAPARATTSRAASLAGRVRMLEAAVERRVDTRGERFRMEVGDSYVARRTDAARELHRAVSSLIAGGGRWVADRPVGTLAGFDLHVTVDRRMDGVRLMVPAAGVELRWAVGEWAGTDQLGVLQSLERRIQRLDATLADTRTALDATRQEADRARSRLDAPFEHDDELRRLERRQAEITERLTRSVEEEPSQPASQRTALCVTAGDGRSSPRHRR